MNADPVREPSQAGPLVWPLPIPDWTTSAGRRVRPASARLRHRRVWAETGGGCRLPILPLLVPVHANRPATLTPPSGKNRKYRHLRPCLRRSAEALGAGLAPPHPPALLPRQRTIDANATDPLDPLLLQPQLLREGRRLFDRASRLLRRNRCRCQKRQGSHRSTAPKASKWKNGHSRAINPRG